jgi:hypothetical protein
MILKNGSNGGGKTGKAFTGADNEGLQLTVVLPPIAKEEIIVYHGI